MHFTNVCRVSALDHIAYKGHYTEIFVVSNNIVKMVRCCCIYQNRLSGVEILAYLFSPARVAQYDTNMTVKLQT